MTGGRTDDSSASDPFLPAADNIRVHVSPLIVNNRRACLTPRRPSMCKQGWGPKYQKYRIPKDMPVFPLQVMQSQKLLCLPNA